MSGLPVLRLVAIEVVRAVERGKLEVEIEVAWQDPAGSVVTRTIGPLKVKARRGERRKLEETLVPPVTAPWVLWTIVARDLDRAAEGLGDQLPEAFERPEVRGALAAVGLGVGAAGALAAVVPMVLRAVGRPDVLMRGGGYLLPETVRGELVVEPDPERRRGGAVRLVLCTG